MIRNKLQSNINNTIDKHQKFESSNFSVSTTSSQYDSSVSLIIKYSIEPKYFIRFIIPNETADNGYYSISGYVCPGPLSLEEKFTISRENHIYSHVSTWLINIWDELSANPFVREIEEQKIKMDELSAKFEEIEDTYFTKKEAIQLQKKLEELEKKLSEQIKSNFEDKKEVTEELLKLKNDIKTLTITILSLKKKGWLRSFTNKVFKWSREENNRKLLTDGYSVIREFLPEEIKGSLPELPKGD